MQNYRRGSHSVYDLKCHAVWCTKYRKPALREQVGSRLRDLFLSYPPTLAVSWLVQRIKGKTSYKLLHEFKSLRKAFWGNHLWARGYFVCSSGNITDEALKACIEQQDTTPNADFRVHDDP